MAVSSLKEGLLPLTQTAMRFYERIGYHDYEGPAVDKDEQERLVADLGSHNAMILRNHGLLTCGATVAEAFNLMLWLETACKAQVDTLAMGREIIVPDEVVLNRTARLYDPDVRQFGQLEWEAMLRLLDREDSSYRD
jgi:ribulose-5-phosphate 4-epimerase/fuculose-1-phosphate aldolase